MTGVLRRRRLLIEISLLRGGGGDVSLGVNIVLYEMKHLRALL